MWKLAKKGINNCNRREHVSRPGLQHTHTITNTGTTQPFTGLDLLAVGTKPKPTHIPHDSFSAIEKDALSLAYPSVLPVAGNTFPYYSVCPYGEGSGIAYPVPHGIFMNDHNSEPAMHCLSCATRDILPILCHVEYSSVVNAVTQPCSAYPVPHGICVSDHCCDPAMHGELKGFLMLMDQGNHTLIHLCDRIFVNDHNSEPAMHEELKDFISIGLVEYNCCQSSHELCNSAQLW
eukprot:1152606-Pelagomonas_calceolata.AAC.1